MCIVVVVVVVVVAAAATEVLGFNLTVNVTVFAVAPPPEQFLRGAVICKKTPTH